MTVTALPPRARPRRQFVSKEAPVIPEAPKPVTPGAVGQGRRLKAARKRRVKRAALKPARV